MKQGKLIIFSAPSGAGKTTIVKHLLKKFPNLSFSISATTRESRGAEVHENDYYFISKEDFLHRVARQEFVEFEEVYSGTFYGTLRCTGHICAASLTGSAQRAFKRKRNR
jgi:guanylate kinase